MVGKTTLYDMEVDANCKHVLTACQDRNIRVYTVGNGKHSRSVSQAVATTRIATRASVSVVARHRR